MNYGEAIEFLYSLRLFGAKLGLQNTRKLASLCGDPQDSLRFIHVAGTNGKGSTCAMLESIYRAAGLRVGLFTSPHLVQFGERIQVNRKLISEPEVIEQVTYLQSVLASFPREEHPTFFEVVTIMALRHFAAEKCDLVIWETGLGGRLDATNIVTPLASVITNIEYDHQKWLGETLERIAHEKAGIIKPGVATITATTDPPALRVISETAAAQESPLTVVKADDCRRSPLDRIELPLLGEHQRLNAATAVATVRVLTDKIPICEQHIVHGLQAVSWPGRLQLITRPSGQKILLDGAHNPAGAESLVLALRQIFPGIQPTMIVGVLADKDLAPICKVLASVAARVLVTPVQSERSASTGELAADFGQFAPHLAIEECSNLSAALQSASGEPFVLITGSLYLIGEALEIFGQQNRGERGLNEWSAAQDVTSQLLLKPYRT